MCQSRFYRGLLQCVSKGCHETGRACVHARSLLVDARSLLHAVKRVCQGTRRPRRYDGVLRVAERGGGALIGLGLKTSGRSGNWSPDSCNRGSMAPSLNLTCIVFLYEDRLQSYERGSETSRQCLITKHVWGFLERFSNPHRNGMHAAPL